VCLKGYGGAKVMKVSVFIDLPDGVLKTISASDTFALVGSDAASQSNPAKSNCSENSCHIYTDIFQRYPVLEEDR
jgi:hypothetical protein